MSSYYPQEPNPFDSSFGYKGLKQNKSTSEHYDDYNPNDRYDPDSRPPLTPLSQKRRESFERDLGERASQLSLAFGVLSLVSVAVWGWWLFGIPSVVLGTLGLWKAKEADRYGAIPAAGRVLSWVAIVSFVLVNAWTLWVWRTN
ncbi:DUF4190 domain-containing protein [Rothia sp. HMSC061D12]|uniref:DUF4190 domain-containing protein n=1 Tax=Rothia sp. HMSC061D12 TaxID=1715161 RepID=UPI0008AA5DB3|nr:DUF4190 domain-containing protein [Rothia sp. HMSC061D12]OHP56087.1 hypothetical protein HMPREF2682_05680 [Rothia sp. HMSC061D12]